MDGCLYDTYIAALQHGTASIPETALKLGVVRRPTPWFHAEIDENIAALAPPESLLDEFKSRYEELTEQGMDDAKAHNTALTAINYDDRYCEYIETSAESQVQINYIRDQLAAGTDVVLVCYENTEHKRCHRELLKEII